MSNPALDLDVADALADKARELLQKAYREEVAPSFKEDRSPVTAADLACEEAMRAILAARLPDDAIWGEELGRASGERMWVLDPIDGTKSFASGSPLFCTLIALVRDAKPVLGIIEVPALAQRFVGAEGELVLQNVGRSEARASELAAARLAQTQPSRRTARLCAAAGIARYGGDAYNFARVASGQLDIALDEGLQVHDYAALLPVIAASGGCYSDFAGNEPAIGEPCDLLCSASAALHEQALALLS